MEHIENVDLRDSIARSYFVALALLPVLLVTALAIFLFVNFLGTQANEIARLVHDLEVQCEFEVGLRSAGNGFFECGTFLPKILLFFVLVLSWVLVSSIVTIRLFEFVPARSIRLPITILVAASVPALLLVKYLITIQSFSSFALIYGIEAVISIWLVHRYFDRFTRLLQNSPIMLITFIACLVIFVGLSLAFSFLDPNIFNSLGTLNTILLYLSLTYAFLGGLFFFGRRSGIPWITGVVVWLLVVNLSGWNHREPVEMKKVSDEGQVKGAEQFVKWMEGRRDRQAYQGKEYPVYIVASAGGGTYAAIRTAYMLAFLQRLCPAFPHHIFAISSVSGGGLGALAFAAQMQAVGAPELGPCQQPDINALAREVSAASFDPSALDRFFSKDMLSTLVGAGLFPDMLQRALPWPVPEFDRSVAFRNTLGQHWRDALKPPTRAEIARGRSMQFGKRAPSPSGCTPEAFFNDCDITAYWRPDGDVPIMIFNTTHVDTGAPIILSNLSKEFYPDTLAAVNLREFTTRSIRLIDAASLSARYPVVLPAGFLPEDVMSRNWFRLVDGGYFDSSGLITAEAVKNKIEAIAKDKGLSVKVRLIFLGERTDVSPETEVKNPAQPVNSAEIYAQLRALPDKADGSPIGSELSAHFIALVQASYQRTNFVVNRFLKTIGNTLAIRWDPASKVALKDYCPDVPLAWYLAPCTLELTRSRLDDTLQNASQPELKALRDDLGTQ